MTPIEEKIKSLILVKNKPNPDLVYESGGYMLTREVKTLIEEVVREIMPPNFTRHGCDCMHCYRVKRTIEKAREMGLNIE